MELKFLGTGAAFNPAMGNNGAYFVHGNDLHLIDCGDQAFSKIMKAKLLEQIPGDIIVYITHLHADHCGSLATLALYAFEVLKRPLTIIHPENGIATMLSLMGVTSDRYTLLRDYYKAGFEATPVPATHVPAIPAFSLFLSDANGRVYYSGDNGELSDYTLNSLREGRLVHAYVDTMFFDGEVPEHPTHEPFSDLLARVELPLRDKITIMHFNRDFRKEALKEGFRVAEMAPEFA